MPNERACRSAPATISSSSRRCWGVWEMGRYSSLEITCVGTGRWRSSHASRSDLRIHPFWAWGFEQDGTVFGLDIFTTSTTANSSAKDYCSTNRFTTVDAPLAPDDLPNPTAASGEEPRTRPQAQQVGRFLCNLRADSPLCSNKFCFVTASLNFVSLASLMVLVSNFEL